MQLELDRSAQVSGLLCRNAFHFSETDCIRTDSKMKRVSMHAIAFVFTFSFFSFEFFEEILLNFGVKFIHQILSFSSCEYLNKYNIEIGAHFVFIRYCHLVREFVFFSVSVSFVRSFLFLLRFVVLIASVDSSIVLDTHTHIPMHTSAATVVDGRRRLRSMYEYVNFVRRQRRWKMTRKKKRKRRKEREKKRIFNCVTRKPCEKMCVVVSCRLKWNEDELNGIHLWITSRISYIVT